MATARWKKLSYWVIGGLVALVALASVTVSFLDWNQYRGTLSRLASEQMGMRVELAGNVSVVLFPRPSLSAETVSIAPNGQGNSEIVATADKISLRLGLSSVLKGEVSIQSLALEGLSVMLDQDADGNWNVRGWPGHEEGDVEGDASGSIGLHRVDIQQGEILLTPFSGQARKLEQLNVRVSGTLPSGPLDWNGGFLVDGEAVETEGRLKPVSARDEISVKTTLRFGGGILEASGRIAGNGNMAGRLELHGDELGRLVQAAGTLAQAGGAPVAPNIPYGFDIQLDKKNELISLQSRQLTLGDTQGMIDLTLAQRSNVTHVAGTISLGVIDVAAWKAAIPSVTDTSEKTAGLAAQEEGMPLSGAIDVTVEGVQMNDGLGQRIDAVVAFKKGMPVLTNLQALLPGAANVSFAGELGADSGQGNIRLSVGSLPELAAWTGAQLPSAIPEGRLSTASAKAKLDYKDGVWVILGLEGKLDTATITGELSGDTSAFIPTHAKLVVDSFDMDILASEQSDADDAALRIPEGMDISLDLTIKELNGFNSNLGEARFVGALTSGQLDVDFLSLDLKDGNLPKGSMKVEGRLANAGDDLSLELTADFQNWPMHISAYFEPRLKEYLVAAQMERLNGSASAAGAFSRMRLGFDAAANGQSVSLTGEIGFPDNRLTFANLQGAVSHNDLAAVMRVADVGDFKSVPVQLTYSIEKAGVGAPLQAKVGGEIVGGKLQLETSQSERELKVSATYDHDSVAALERQLGMVLPGLAPADGLRSEVIYSSNQNEVHLQVPSLRNGVRSASADIRLADAQRISGRIALSKIELLDAKQDSDSGGSASGSFTDQLRAFDAYSGEVQLSLDDIRISGQRVSAPNAQLILEDGKARVSLGQNASLNGQPSEMSADLSLRGTMPFNFNSKVTGFELAPLFVSRGFSDLVSSAMSGDLTLSGELAPAGGEGVMSTLSGTGDLSGSAGQLKLFSVGNLITQMQTAQSGRGFLAGIGQTLRSGQTPFGTFSAKFTVDSGVMLLETAKAEGDWGQFVLDGQINLADQLLALKGSLALTSPPDTPAIPVTYEGPFEGATSNWSSRIFERFVLAGIERRLRSTLFKEAEDRAAGGAVEQNPGAAIFSRAFGLLGQLKTAQEEKKRKEEEAKKRAAEQGGANGGS